MEPNTVHLARARSHQRTAVSSQPVRTLVEISRQSAIGNPEGSAALLELLLAGRLIRRNLLAVLGKYQLSETSFSALIALYASDPDPIMPADLAFQAEVSRPTMSVTLDGMLRHGWIERWRSERDRRSQSVRLTEAGRELMARVTPPFLRELERNAGALAPEECACLERTCTRLLGHPSPNFS